MYLDDYIKAILDEIGAKLFASDAFVSQKLAEISVGEKQGELAEMEYDVDYSDVNGNFLSYVIGEYWELKRLLTGLTEALTFMQAGAREIGEGTADFSIKAKLYGDANGHLAMIKERLEQLSDGDRSDRVLAIIERHGHKTQLEALYWYDEAMRYRLLDDCRTIKRIYAFTRDYIRKNDIQLATGKGVMMNMMI